MGGLQRHVTLPPTPDSARQARRFVAEVLTAAGAAEFLDVAALLTSELVTNGIVHAHTDLQVVVDATPAWVRVEVSDRNPMLPSRRDYTDDALTGRGLEMVELLAQDFGMQPLGDDGKRVWFRLGEAPQAPAEAPDAASGADGDTDAGTVEIRLLHLPLTLYGAWQQHADAILREATLVALNDSGGNLPEEFALAGQALAAVAAGVAHAMPSGHTTTRHADLTVSLPRAAVPNFPVLRDVLRRCNDLAIAGHLLVPPSLPELQAVRRWVCDEIGRQGQDLPPRAWEDPTVEEVPVDPLAADAADEVRRAAVPQLAADRWNRIIAVNAAAASLLGWEAHELEGRRLVTIIPPRLRDRHIAGFTRHMLGGASTMIGRPTPVPALRRDGSEIPIALLIESRTDIAGRRVFVGTMGLQRRPEQRGDSPNSTE